MLNIYNHILHKCQEPFLKTPRIPLEKCSVYKKCDYTAGVNLSKDFLNKLDGTDDLTAVENMHKSISAPLGVESNNMATSNPTIMEIASPTTQREGDGGNTVTAAANNGSGNATSESSSSAITPAALAENTLHVEISDALSEKDKVKFTVHTRTTLPGFAKQDNNVVRQHEEFVWLHDRFEENEEYAGYIIPPCPPRPDFDASREKLQRLGEGEGNMTKEEFKKMKLELEAEYLATFKKTVAMHEVFLRRLANHPVFRVDQHLKVFLEYDQDLCAKPRKKMAIFGGFVKSLGKTTDEILMSATVRDVNDFFENELQFLIEYHGHLRDAAVRTEKMTQRHKEVSECHQKISNALMQLSTAERGSMETFCAKSAEIFEK
ncbi:unnamed protein product [Ceratitis capitata]|uniref:(Mediterranean fruit fly) hypothetical protein n=2 Tax=Ceratitis capitata TaxID=7213 RepID=A0A811UGP5_CERCA|nr:unnamed protein product [Ceratitis capitata]